MLQRGEENSTEYSLLHCPKHDAIRGIFLPKITLNDFPNLNDLAKLKYLVNSPDIVKLTAQFIIDCFDNRVAD